MNVRVNQLSSLLYKLVASMPLAFLLVACGGGAATQDGKLQVIATTTIVGDVVTRVAGDAAHVTTLLAPGVNPHIYEPTPQDVKTVADASVIFENGVGYESFMQSLVENAGGKAQVVAVSEGIELLSFAGDHDDGETGGKDPHVWFNPQNVKMWASNIERKLSELDPAHAAAYKANAEKYRAQLDELDTWAKMQVSQIPEANRKLITDHDTFGYLAQHYGFQLIGQVLPSVSADAEPSAQQITHVISIIREQHVPAVFVANEANTTLARQVSNDTGAKLIPVYVESLGKPGSETDTYEKFMRYNISKIVDGLT